ncbi:MAG: AEC family transporter [Candidatus Omnitrophica bacterium]|nr:AEC family transporter [Candidatus Omnitrophota bacterium]MDE2222347.1 AEC family transporter [Candidatus Omnitrophota bacterium]
MLITFQTTAAAVAQIFAMGALGFYLIKSRLIHESGLRILSFLSVNVFFPLFIFNQILKNFDLSRMPFWWQFPLINISLVVTGLGIALLASWRHRGHQKDGFVAASALHNAGYIPLLMLMSLPLGPAAGELYACIILSIIGFDTCLWSLGVWLMTRSQSPHMDFRKMINPPLVSMAAAIIITLVFGRGCIPEAVLKPVKILGDAAMGVAMIVIGGNLALSSLKQVNWPRVTGAVLIKLMLLPSLALLVVPLLKLNPWVALVAMIQSCMPSSITLSIIGRNYETKNQDLVNQIIFMTHFLSIITIPVFLGLYGKLTHF